MIALTVIVPIARAVFAMGMEKLVAIGVTGTTENPGGKAEA